METQPPLSVRATFRDLVNSRLMRLLAINLGIGIALAVIMVAGLLALDTHHLRTLIFHDRSGFLAVAVMLGGFIVTFGSIAMGSAIMWQARSDDMD